MVELAAQNHIDSVAKDQLLREFNCHYFNKQWYSKHKANPLLIEMEENRVIKDPYLEEAINFCMYTNVVKQLGISLVDILNMDLNSFILLKDIVSKEDKRRAKILEDEAREQEKRSEALLSGKK